jgi:hypothetical protein
MRKASKENSAHSRTESNIGAVDARFWIKRRRALKFQAMSAATRTSDADRHAITSSGIADGQGDQAFSGPALHYVVLSLVI